MKKEDINYEFISKIEIKVDDTLFYIPGEIVKGQIIINPKYQMKINDTTLHLTLKIMQYEFWDYSNKEIDKLKNIKVTTIQTEEIIYKLKHDEISINKDFDNFSIIDKEDENKIISIPFQFKITEQKILPTFQFVNKTYFLGIRHLFLVECKEYNSSNYIGLFIGKNKKNDFTEPKEIKENYNVGLGSLEIKVNYPKLSYKFDEEINLEIKTNSNLHFKKITEIQQKFYRNIEWVGYMKNTLLDKNIYHKQKYILNENEYGLLMRLNAPFLPIESTILGPLMCLSFGFMDGPDSELHPYVTSYTQLFLGILAMPFGLVYGVGHSFYKQKEILKDVLNLNKNQKDFNNNFKSRMKKNNEEEKLLIQNLKRFVYFKDNKVIGFIKFERDITPPVDGYYFKCNFNMKIEVQISGIILNSNKYLKTQIDMYDSDEYITNMKKIFKN